MIFQEKHFSYYVQSTDQTSLSDYLLEILGNMYIVTICFPVCDAIKFEIKSINLIKLFLYTTENVRTKI